MKKLKIAFSKGTEQSYVDFLSKYFKLEVLDGQNLQEFPDLVIFTGGADVNPDHYSENSGKYTFINKERDSLDIKLYQTVKGRSKMLGICRGAQFLTVMNGGRLIQHVENHTSPHIIVTDKGYEYNITSTHHQMMYPYELNINRYRIIAYSKYFKSPTYLNGNNEEIDLHNEFLEPEIVFYNKTNSLCIQGHPEFENCNSETQDFCLRLIQNLIENNL